MKVLLTGAFGNLGCMVLEALLAAGHAVIAYDVETATTARVAKPFARRANIHWGDIRNEAEIKGLVHQVDAVIHLAAVLVPLSESHPELAYQVNVEGTRYIVEAIADTERKPLLAYCSSFTVFGPQGRPPPRTLDETPIASDHYSSHKIACEQLVKSMRSPWAILRLGGMADGRMRNGSVNAFRYALSMKATNRFEYVHPKDVATAFVNVLTQTQAHNQIHLIGGGRDCQVTHQDVMNVALGAMGITLRASDFGQTALYADWVDSGESQRLLNFQNHSFDDFRREVHDAFKLARPFVRPFAPVIRRALKLLART